MKKWNRAEWTCLRDGLRNVLHVYKHTRSDDPFKRTYVICTKAGTRVGPTKKYVDPVALKAFKDRGHD